VPSLVVSQPTNNQIVGLNKPFPVIGQASDNGMPEPIGIDSVTVQVDGGPPIEAILTAIPNWRATIVAFKAQAFVTGGQDPHVVVVTATNDLGTSLRRVVAVFTGIPFQIQAPAVQIEVRPVPTLLGYDPRDPTASDALNHLISNVQQQLAPLAGLLASSGKTLAGPSVIVGTNRHGESVLRIGLWIVGPTFPVSPAKPPHFPLPLLPDAVASSEFDAVPFLPLSRLGGGPLTESAFGVSLPTSTLQAILDAMLPTFRSVAAKKLVTLGSVVVTCISPGSVVTSFVADVGFPPATTSGTITETLGTVFVAGAEPPQSIPAVVSSSSSSTSVVLGQLLLSLICPLFLMEALVISIATPIAVGGVATDVAAMAAMTVRNMRKSVPLTNPGLNDVPDFPMLVPN